MADCCCPPHHDAYQCMAARSFYVDSDEHCWCFCHVEDCCDENGDAVDPFAAALDGTGEKEGDGG